MNGTLSLGITIPISQIPFQAAPGAVGLISRCDWTHVFADNASEAAAVIEMARLLVQHPPKSTVIFILYTGEEQVCGDGNGMSS